MEGTNTGCQLQFLQHCLEPVRNDECQVPPGRAAASIRSAVALAGRNINPVSGIGSGCYVDAACAQHGGAARPSCYSPAGEMERIEFNMPGQRRRAMPAAGGAARDQAGEARSWRGRGTAPGERKCSADRAGRGRCLGESGYRFTGSTKKTVPGWRRNIASRGADFHLQRQLLGFLRAQREAARSTPVPDRRLPDRSLACTGSGRPGISAPACASCVAGCSAAPGHWQRFLCRSMRRGVVGETCQGDGRAR